MTVQTHGHTNITPVIRTTDGAAADDIDQRVREWCEALGLPFGDLSAEEAAK